MAGLPERTEAFIFDLDGVIFDSERAVYEEWKLLAKKYGFENLDEPYVKCIGVNAKTSRQIFLDYYGPDFPYDVYEAERSASYHAKYDHGRLPLKPGVRELLQALRKRGYRLAIASSTRTAVVQEEIRAAGLLDFFDRIVGGDQVSRSKPEPDIFLAAAGSIGAKPEACCVIEDSYNGIRAAHRAGMFPIMIPDMLPPDEEMRSLAGMILESLADLQALLPPAGPEHPGKPGPGNGGTEEPERKADGPEAREADRIALEGMEKTEPELRWEEISTEHVVQDRWIDFRKSAYRFPDGRIFEPYYSFTRRDFAVVVATDEAGRYLCVRQFRQGIRKVTTEFPAGAIEKDDGENLEEAALRAARRELLEETGCVSDQWRHLLTIPASATISDNYACLFAAEGCRKVAEQNLDEMELIEVRRHTDAELKAMMDKGSFEQSVHVLAWLLARQGAGAPGML